MAAGHLLVFGDQALKTHLDIKALARQARSSLLLRTFLQKTTDALRSHIRNLPPCERRTILPFSSILELAEAHTRNGVNNVVVSTILLCVVQLGSLILQVTYLIIINVHLLTIFDRFEGTPRTTRSLMDLPRFAL